jgi:hypothetical protein
VCTNAELQLENYRIKIWWLPELSPKYQQNAKLLHRTPSFIEIWGKIELAKS